MKDTQFQFSDCIYLCSSDPCIEGRLDNSVRASLLIDDGRFDNEHGKLLENIVVIALKRTSYVF